MLVNTPKLHFLLAGVCVIGTTVPLSFGQQTAQPFKSSNTSQPLAVVGTLEFPELLTA